jgi:deoxyribodipyrimidine photo-lyase
VGDALCWIRRDLRLNDHRALSEATQNHSRVAVAFVYDTQILDELPDRDDRRLTFIHAALDEVDEELRAKGSCLLARYGDPVEVIPRLAAELGAEKVYANHDDDPYALRRDARVAEALRKDGRELVTFKDCVVFERDEVIKSDGDPYRVYTPYSIVWMARLSPADYAEAKVDGARFWPAKALPLEKGNLALPEVGFTRSELIVPTGRSGAVCRLRAFEERIAEYAEERDYPDREGTSTISVHLRHGTLGIREAVRAALRHESAGATKWLKELIWRDFYHMILAQFPFVVDQAFRPEYRDVEWPGTEGEFRAWCEGRTGYPLVDAAMRCLVATGWMHNRLRMVTASFLAKNLMVDWRRGEAFFARYLLDFDLASNNGGWQWSASTGVDAQPYFRVFNPVLQSRKFDPDARFITAWCPELAELPVDLRHWPHDAGLMRPDGYPSPIVNHDTQRAKAIALLSREK